MRTCIGCREKSAKSDLLRVVADGPAVVPDPRGCRPGRGAHLHATPECLALALRRRAFGRALRRPEPLDTAAVAAWIDHRPVRSERAYDNDERSMSTDR
jgi:predicted RNA-binding protein YlxR (DUF448 family)